MIYEVEQYELHASKYRVNADSKAQAIQMVLDGQGDMVDNSTEFIGVGDNGLPLEQSIIEDCEALGIVTIDNTVPSIREVNEVEDES